MVMAGVQVVGLGSYYRRVGLLRVDTALAVHNPRLAKQIAREEFKIETYLAEECLRNGAVQVYRYFYILTFTFYSYRISKFIVGINHRVETGEVA